MRQFQVKKERTSLLLFFVVSLTVLVSVGLLGGVVLLTHYQQQKNEQFTLQMAQYESVGKEFSQLVKKRQQLQRSINKMNKQEKIGKAFMPLTPLLGQLFAECRHCCLAGVYIEKAILQQQKVTVLGICSSWQKLQVFIAELSEKNYIDEVVVEQVVPAPSPADDDISFSLSLNFS